jgi:dolichyl-phosphate-mannose-protein mannosyltransferase
VTAPIRPRRFLLTVILILGTGLRLWFYSSRPSLTIDETTLSLDLGLRSFAGLLRPLASLQTGPVLFLWAVKLCTAALGMSEYTLRLVPLAAGSLIPFLVWRVGRRLAAEPAAILATALAAFAPALIQYSVTAKPYITDALFALLIAWCTLDLLDRPDATGVWVRLGVVGLVSILGSLAAPFLLAGATAAIVVGVRPLAGQPARRLILSVAVWGAVWVPLYALVYRPVAASWYMQQFWGPASFAPGRAAGWWNLARGVFMSVVGRSAPAAVILSFAAIVVVGLWVWLRRLPRARVALVGVPLLLLLFASSLHRYPLAARLLMFSVPTLTLGLAAAFAVPTLRRARLGWGFGGLAVAALIAVNVSHPYRPASTRQAVDSLLRLARSGEPIYLASGSIPAWAFYTTDWGHPDTGYLDWIERYAGTPGAAAFHNTPPRGRPVGPDEGDSLQTTRGGRIELLGLASGIQWREGRGFGVPVVSDSGWAAREAARIGAVAHPTVWLLVANSYPTMMQELSGAVERVGGAIDIDAGVGGVRLTRYRFPSALRP